MDGARVEQGLRVVAIRLALNVAARTLSALDLWLLQLLSNLCHLLLADVTRTGANPQELT